MTVTYIVSKPAAMEDPVLHHFTEARSVLEAVIADPHFVPNIRRAGALMSDAILRGNKVISCGNGGSMCDAMHFAEELTGRFRDTRPSLPAIAISDPSHISCVANDFGVDYIFSRYVEGIGRKGDVLLAISTSGNSKNIINAVNAAKSKGMFVVGLTAKDGPEMASLVDLEIRSPKSQWSDRVQEIHIKIIHSLIDYIETNV